MRPKAETMSHDRFTLIRVYVACCVLVASAAAFFAIRQPQSVSLPATVGFGILAFVAAQFPISLTTGTLYDISFVITIVALVASGPGTAVLATASATAVLRDAFHRPPIRHVFNIAQLTLSAAVCGIVYTH